jgi:hypothetical protein
MESPVRPTQRGLQNLNIRRSFAAKIFRDDKAIIAFNNQENL